MLLAGSLAALSAGKQVQDVTLQGTANYTAGSDQETGPATLEGLGHLQSSVVLNLSGNQRGEIQNNSQAAWIGTNGRQNLETLQNSLYPAAWFFPALFVQGFVQDATYLLSFVGVEQLNGAQVNHVRVSRTPPGKGDPATMSLLSQLATSDLYLDVHTLLPTALAFNIYADDDTSVGLPVQIQFSEYRSSAGLQIPYRVQKFLQGTLMLDFSVTSAVINSGLSPSQFQIQ